MLPTVQLNKNSHDYCVTLKQEDEASYAPDRTVEKTIHDYRVTLKKEDEASHAPDRTVENISVPKNEPTCNAAVQPRQ